MARKSATRNNSTHRQPNAPELQQILQQSSTQQPPLNPYYQDIGSANSTADFNKIQPPPPPYSSHSTRGPATVSSAIYHSVPMSQLNNDISYPRFSHGSHTPVVIQAPSVPYDHRANQYRRRIRAFNSHTMLITIFTILMSLWAYQMYSERSCIEQFVVHKPNKDIEITIAMVRQVHLNLVHGGAFLFLLCLVRSCFGFEGKHFGCYLFLVSLVTFFLTLLTGYVAWLAFYSPCSGSLENIAFGFGKTLVSKITDSLPSPDKNYFGESNVVAQAKADPKGLMIFLLDLGSFIFYFSTWLSAMTAC